MKAALLAIAFVFVPATTIAASFSLIPTSSLFIGQGEFASFDVIYTSEPGDAPALAVNLRITYGHSSSSPNTLDEIRIVRDLADNPFDIPTFSPPCNRHFCFPKVDIGGSQQFGPPIDATDGIKLGELSFGVEGPMMGNAGVITLTPTFPQTGSRDADFAVIPDTTPEVLAVIYVPEPGLMSLIWLCLFAVFILHSSAQRSAFAQAGRMDLERE